MVFERGPLLNPLPAMPRGGDMIFGIAGCIPDRSTLPLSGLVPGRGLFGPRRASLFFGRTGLPAAPYPASSWSQSESPA